MTFTSQELVAVTALQKLANEYEAAYGRGIHYLRWVAEYILPEPDGKTYHDPEAEKKARAGGGGKGVHNVEHLCNSECYNTHQTITNNVEKKQWVPERGEKYYIPDIHLKDFASSMKWSNDPCDKRWLDRGLVCQTEEEAREMANRMLAAIKK